MPTLLVSTTQSVGATVGTECRTNAKKPSGCARLATLEQGVGLGVEGFRILGNAARHRHHIPRLSYNADVSARCPSG